MWIYGSGFPKSHNIGKAIDKIEGNEREVIEDNPNKRTNKAELCIKPLNSLKKEFDLTKGNSEWEGWGTALKPAHEPIVMARKPFKGNVAQNVLEWGTGGINIDESRIGTEQIKSPQNKDPFKNNIYQHHYIINEGRWPANIIFDDDTDVEWKRFFYCPKASKKDRDEGMDGFEDKGKGWSNYLPPTTNGTSDVMYERNTTVKNNHPTVKPTELMLYLIKLVTPKGGTVMDCFMGSGSTGKAAVRGGFDFIGIEREEEYYKIAEARINNK
jgi:site-specific DNA-methyltransferase (adenine-specific)